MEQLPDIDDLTQHHSPLHIKHKKRRWWLWAGALFFITLLLIGLAGVVWYEQGTKALDPQAQPKLFAVREGDSADMIATRLHKEGFIKDPLAFKIALRLRGDAAHNIKQGKYRLSAAEDVAAIITKLESGKVDVTTIQLLPGKTLKELREVMLKAGYDKNSVEEALTRTYDHPLLRHKPAAASLEGYIYPDTYEIDLSTHPSVLLEASFDNFSKKLAKAGVAVAKYGDLNFHQAVIMGSIIEKEVNTSKDRPIVAQIFLKRLAIGMQLGSDATFVYAAREMGVPPAVDLDSPYNTRVHTGLPPGPISNMTVDALVALKYPAKTDYLYFVTDDHNVTHYGATAEEHEANVRQHCGVRCEL